MPLISLCGAEPIAGYSVTERLGAGGYGEVWKAEVPGGLQKAIKFIYGYLNEEKASRELKALNRIKQLRHPFLLSLERIEVVEGQLLIVTELADASVKDRFLECCQQGLCGIPREELLNHLRDAADALDFLSASGLQHLDVKPENLLLVGGRVKVADFGLVKDLQERNCSLMGGMTPIYAPPEVFDGRPNPHSDQYSLAIVYQELLTGVLPFPGTTAAQLASQHLHSRPRLESLPPADREVVARALAKSPHERFPSSRALIDALLAAGREQAGAPLGQAPAQVPSGGDTTSASRQDTGLAGGSRGGGPRRSSAAKNGRPSDDVPAAMFRQRSSFEPEAAEIHNLPPLEVQPEELGLRPTLFLGLGGTAGQVLKRLRHRLYERFGDRSATPMIQMLLVDTDSAALARHAGTIGEGGLAADELLAMPLRRPEDYRPDSVEILQWLSRRWLYNIPRSLKTEGLRPLGRLALVDHADSLFGRVRAALERCLSVHALAATEKNTGLPIRDHTPRVYLLASLSGGTGGGMVLDVAYAVRMLLAELEQSKADVCGLLMHSTSRASQDKDLANANALAALSELAHFARGGYPGEPACGIRAFEEQKAPFRNTYFVPLGERLNDEQFHQAADQLAEYLYLDTATLAGPLLEKCRAAEIATGRPPEVRTLGICRRGCRPGLVAQVADHLRHHLLLRWAGQRGSDAKSKANDSRLKELFAQWVGEFGLDPASLQARCRQAIEQALEFHSSEMLHHLAGELLNESLKDPSISPETRWPRLAREVYKILAPAESPHAPSEPDKIDLKHVLESLRTAYLKEVERGLDERLIVAADESPVRLGGVLALAKGLQEYLQELEQQFAAELELLKEQLSSRGQAPPRLPPVQNRKPAKEPPIAPVETWREPLAVYGRLILDQWVVDGARRLVQSLSVKARTVSESLDALWRETQRLAKQCDAPSPWSQSAEEGAPESDEQRIDRAILGELQQRFERLASQFEQAAERDVLAPRGGLIRLLESGDETLRGLPGLLQAAARWEVNQAIKEIDVAQLVLGSRKEPAAKLARLEQFISDASPPLLACGGAKRLLLMLPAGSDAERLPQMIAERRNEIPSVIFSPGAELVACYEAEQIPLDRAAALLVQDDPQCAAAAQRLHTRSDIQWSAL